MCKRYIGEDRREKNAMTIKEDFKRIWMKNRLLERDLYSVIILWELAPGELLV